MKYGAERDLPLFTTKNAPTIVLVPLSQRIFFSRLHPAGPQRKLIPYLGLRWEYISNLIGDRGGLVVKENSPSTRHVVILNIYCLSTTYIMLNN